MLVKCKACGVSFYKMGVNKGSFVCSICLKSDFTTNQYLKTIDNSSIIIELKNKIKSGEYKVDSERLAKKMLEDAFQEDIS